MDTRTDSRWLRAILKSNVLAMGCWRFGGHITAKNDALVRLIGYTNKEMKDGYLTKADFESVYIKCGAALHARNLALMMKRDFAWAIWSVP